MDISEECGVCSASDAVRFYDPGYDMMPIAACLDCSRELEYAGYRQIVGVNIVAEVYPQ